MRWIFLSITVPPMLAKGWQLPPAGDGRSSRSGMVSARWSSATGKRCSSRAGRETHNRYFPELIEPLQFQLPDRAVLDGEIVISRNGGPRLRGAKLVFIRPRRGEGHCRRRFRIDRIRRSACEGREGICAASPSKHGGGSWSHPRLGEAADPHDACDRDAASPPIGLAV